MNSLEKVENFIAKINSSDRWNNIWKKQRTSGPSTGSCCWFNRGVLNDSLRMGVDGPAQLVVTGSWRIGENFPAFKYTMATGTDIYTLWKDYLSREVRDLASMDIRYIEEAIKT